MDKSAAFREWIKDIAKEAIREVLEEQKCKRECKREKEEMENLLDVKDNTTFLGDFTLMSITAINNEKYLGYHVITLFKRFDLKIKKGKSSDYGFYSAISMDDLREIIIYSLRYEVLTLDDERTPNSVRSIILKDNIKECKILLLTLNAASFDDEIHLFVYYT